MNQCKRLLEVEFLKNKRLFNFEILILGTFIGLMLGVFLYLANKSIFIDDHSQWLALWSEMNLFATQIFIPIILSIVVALNIQNELRNNNLLRIMVTPVNLVNFVISKWLYFVILSLINQLISWLMFIGIGSLLGFPNNMNPLMFLKWSILAWVGSLGIIAIQILIGFIVRQFISVVLVNFGLVIVSFISSIISEALSWINPYSLILIGSHAKNTMYWSLYQIIFFISTTLITVVFGIYLTKKVIIKFNS
ncbi:ABC transporter permease [Convivina intestini]|uniref:ABC transporter permease n=1 Tax=Convivina intestini TaxID=1505726 RepID=UPI00200C2D89|nr:ABC transporter permease [Convivina intestini]CAH1852379.1 hypothetical protein R078131_00461 [Convivina intestini]